VDLSLIASKMTDKKCEDCDIKLEKKFISCPGCKEVYYCNNTCLDNHKIVHITSCNVICSKKDQSQWERVSKQFIDKNCDYIIKLVKQYCERYVTYPNEVKLELIFDSINTSFHQTDKFLLESSKKLIDDKIFLFFTSNTDAADNLSFYLILIHKTGLKAKYIMSIDKR
jgi:hypothetical protein